ncbi:MAG: M20 family metallopeptidase [Clostridia bacterium]|nr:M20 family metallopeptidase [Clostridia bacterium]
MKDLLKEGIFCSVESNYEELKAIKKYLYDNPEVGGEEEKASRILCDFMKKNGFDVTENFHDIPWCFRAAYDSGRPGVSVGMTAEYDALPEIGHGCGHNIIATAPMGAAVALKKAVDELGGKVVLYGTPAEECFVRKCDLAREGAFKEIDLCLNIHPFGRNLKSGRTTALDAWQVDFFGKSSHAGVAPEEGINALDAAVHFYEMIGFEKQYLKNTNIYGVFADGGIKCSVIPDHAAVKYLVRAPRMKDIKAIRDLFERTAEACCRLVGTTYKIWNNEPGNMDVVTNYTLAHVFEDIYEKLSGKPMEDGVFGGSTDVGDVSHCVPTIMPCIGLNCPDTMIHTVEFREAVMTEAGDNAMKWGAEAMALTALEVMTDPDLLRGIREEFNENPDIEI